MVLYHDTMADELEDSILTTAEQNARSTLSRLLEGFGFQTVEFH